MEPTPVDGLRRRRNRTLRRRGLVASLAATAIVGGVIAAILSKPASERVVVVPAAPGVSTTAGPPTSEHVVLPAVPRVSTTARPPTTVPPPSCRQGQIPARLVAIQGATGNWTAAFWVADTSAQPCLLTSPARIDLVNRSGEVQLSATSSFSPIPLTADTSIPTDHMIKSGELASLVLFWPTDANAAAAIGRTNPSCPTPHFVPFAARISFGDTTTVTVTDLTGTMFGAPHQAIALCGQQISIEDSPRSHRNDP